MNSDGLWYRNPWVWMVIAIPFSSVLFGIVMITSATRFPDDVVVDNYYKEGKAINQRLEMDTAAVTRNVSASGVVADGHVSLDVLGALDSAIVMNLYHVTDSDLDQQVVLLPDTGNRYSASADTALFNEAGVWYVELVGADAGWRVRDRIETPVDRLELRAR